MNRKKIYRSDEGVATIEFALTAGFFLMMVVAVVAGGHLFWTHNALVEATRRGARYAANQCNPADTACPGYTTAITRIKNMVLYNSETAGTTPFVPNLQASNVIVTYTVAGCTLATCKPGANFGVASGAVSVKIQGYNYNFVLSPAPIPMPPYETTVAGESAGYTAGQNVCN